MNIGHHSLPAARRIDSRLGEYVRSEYREKECCWFASAAARDGKVMPTVIRGAERAPQPEIGPICSGVRRCPVTGAVSCARPIKWLSVGGGASGDR